MYFNKYLKTLYTAKYYFLIVFLFCCILTFFSYLVTNILSIEPCVLCSMQRIIFSWILGTGVVGFISEIIFLDLLLKNYITNLVRNLFLWLCLINICCCSILGSLIAGRQSWLQYLAINNINTVHNSIHSCAGGLEHLFAKYPLATAISKSLQPNFACSQVHLKFLGLSLANWSLLSFIVIFLFNCMLIYKKITKKI